MIAVHVETWNELMVRFDDLAVSVHRSRKKVEDVTKKIESIEPAKEVKHKENHHKRGH